MTRLAHSLGLQGCGCSSWARLSCGLCGSTGLICCGRGTWWEVGLRAGLRVLGLVWLGVWSKGGGVWRII